MSSHTLEIESSDVIRLVLQFLKENGLNGSFDALQRESQVTLNLVGSAEQLEKDVLSGKWDDVLIAISGLKLPLNKLMNLYDHIVREMIEVKELDVARTMMKETAVLVKMKSVLPERFLRLETLMNKASTSSMTFTEESDLEALYPQGNKQIRRRDLASELLREIAIVEPSRLLSLLTKSIRFSAQYEGLAGLTPRKPDGPNSDQSSSVTSLLPSNQYDLFLGRFPTNDDEEEAPPKVLSTKINFQSPSSFPEAVKFSPDGSMMIIGARDGFIEVFNPYTGQLREELEYQAKEQFMALASAIMCLSFSKNGEYMMAGGQDGSIGIFRLKTGECVKEFRKIHSAPITSSSFSKDDSQILTSSLDGSVQISGIKSGKVLRLFKPDSSFSSSPSFVQQAHFSRDNKFIVSASSDGLIRVWDNSGTGSSHPIRSFPPGNDPIELSPSEDTSHYDLIHNHSSDFYSSSSTKPALSSHPKPSVYPSSSDIHTLIPMPHPGLHQFIVSDKSCHIHLMSIQGKTLRTFSHPNFTQLQHSSSNQHSSARDVHSVSQHTPSTLKSSNLDSASSDASIKPPSPFIAATISPKAHFLYAVTQDSTLFTWNLLTGDVILPPLSSLHTSEVISIHHHPFRNLLLSFSTDGMLRVWKP